MASTNILTLTRFSDSVSVYLNEAFIVKVFPTSSGTGVVYQNGGNDALRDVIYVTESPSSINSSAANLFTVSIKGENGGIYLHADRVLSLNDRDDGDVDVWYDNAGQDEERLISDESISTINARINAL